MKKTKNVLKNKGLAGQLIKLFKSEQKQHELMRNFISKENKIKYLCETARILNEIILVDTLEDLTTEEKYETVMDIAQYYAQHFEDKLIELDAPEKHI